MNSRIRDVAAGVCLLAGLASCTETGPLDPSLSSSVTSLNTAAATPAV